MEWRVRGCELGGGVVPWARLVCGVCSTWCGWSARGFGGVPRGLWDWVHVFISM